MQYFMERVRISFHTRSSHPGSCMVFGESINVQCHMCALLSPDTINNAMAHVARVSMTIVLLFISV